MTSSLGWVCAQCGRQFARAHQSHECAPAMSLETYFEGGPAFEKPIFDEVMARLSGIGPISVEPVSVGIFLKNPHKFAELRPMRNWVSVSFPLSRVARHRLIIRKVIPYGQNSPRWYHVANVKSAEDVDDELIALLAEAYDE